MKNPFDIEDAFNPMYTDNASIVGKNCRTTLKCCVFNDSTSDPTNPDMVDTDIERIDIVTRREDWPQVKLMEIGDKVEIANTRKRYIIDGVRRDSSLGVVISARSE